MKIYRPKDLFLKLPHGKTEVKKSYSTLPGIRKSRKTGIMIQLFKT